MSDLLEYDLKWTLANKKKLEQNENLLFWYKKLYEFVFNRIDSYEDKFILEVGSGTSPLKLYYPDVKTSDILPLPYLDYVMDCNQLNKFSGIPDNSIDVITLTNVLHHLIKPLDFLANSKNKLKKDGLIIATEPYFSIFSYPIYKLLHHEPVDFSIDSPELQKVEGPLSSSNQALPHKIFFNRKDWRSTVEKDYVIDSIQYFTFISYMLTGGISRKFPVPVSIYKFLFLVDRYIANMLPQLFASFFIVTLRRKTNNA